jgi:(2R)-ethylmalonyl-CoA mutase
VVGGIIPEADGQALLEQGVAAVFTPKDYDANAVMAKVVETIRRAHGLD